MMRRQSSGVVATKSAAVSQPAPFTRPSMPPASVAKASTALATAPASRMSAGWHEASPPSARIAAATCSEPAASRSSSPTRTPSSPRRSAIARAMPLAAPVTRTRRSASPTKPGTCPPVHGSQPREGARPRRILAAWRARVRRDANAPRGKGLGRRDGGGRDGLRESERRLRGPHRRLARVRRRQGRLAVLRAHPGRSRERPRTWSSPGATTVATPSPGAPSRHPPRCR